jgi:hypothetical protein
MVESGAYCALNKRLAAVGNEIQDSIIDGLCKKAEVMYLPKRIHSKNDWLA